MKNTNNTIPIALISDSKQLIGLSVAIINLLETAKRKTFYEIYLLLDSSVSDKDIELIKNIEKNYKNGKIIPIKIENPFKDIKNQHDYVSNADLFKLIMASTLPNLDKVLYLDTDILIREDLSDLFNTDLENNYLGGVHSFAHAFVLPTLNKTLDIPNLDNYTGCGVLLFNLKKIRQDNLEPELHKYIGKFKGSVDQHLVNKVCYGKIKNVNHKYNWTITMENSYLQDEYYPYSKNYMDTVYKNPAIYHTTGPNKYWNCSNLRFSKEWYKYFKKSPYRDNPEINRIYSSNKSKLDLDLQILFFGKRLKKSLLCFKKSPYRNNPKTNRIYSSNKSKLDLDLQILFFGKQLKKSLLCLKKSKYERINAKRYSKDITQKEVIYLLSKYYKERTGESLNLKNVKTYNEKMQWLKIYYHNPLMTICSDKYRVREYIKEKIGEKYLVPLLGVWDKPEDIDFDKLPKRFVLKVNWGSGQNVIVTDKSKLNIEETKKKLNNWISPTKNNYYRGFEWAYKNIEPKIICEEYIESLSKDALDFKFLCFNGKTTFCWASNKYKTIQERSFYDMDWNMQDIELAEPNKIKAPKPVKKPKNFDEMRHLAEILCKGWSHIRVDFYNTDDKLYMGELTFYTNNGMCIFKPKEWNLKLGQMIELPPKMLDE